MFADYMEGAQADTVEELTKGILDATHAAARNHGDDPRMPVIISAAFAYALELLGHGDPTIPETVRGMLERGAPPGD